MSHEITTIDRVGLRGQQAWHGLGVVIDDDLTAVEAGERFGMFWGIDGWRLEAISPDGERMAVDTHVANVRTADADGNSIRHLLGVVGADYKVCQNRELAEFTDALAQTGRVTIESCGSLRGGKRVWFLARGDAFEIGGTGDKVWPYLLVSNGHDGTQAIRVTPTTIRVVCSNTLHMVIPREEGLRAETAAICIRHSGQIADKLVEAKHAMAHYQAVLGRNRELFEAMHARKIEREQALQLFAGVYAANWEAPTWDELNSADAKVRRTASLRKGRMDDATKAFLDRWAQEKAAVGLDDSIWSAFNALSGFLQHDKKARGKDDANRVERRRESNLFGLNAARTHEALAAALAIAG